MPQSTMVQIQRRRWLMLTLGMIAVGLLVHIAVRASPIIEHYVGSAYDTSGRAVYMESHWISESQGQRELLVLFECPDGRPFARKQVRAAGLTQAPSFTLYDARSGYEEGVRERSGGSREVFFREVGKKSERSALLTIADDLVIDAGFDNFIRKHWDALSTGAPQHLDFLVPSRLRSYPFTLTLVGDELKEGQPARRFLLALDTWYGFAIPPISFAYATDSKTIREYQGTSNLRDHNGKSLNVRIEFPHLSRTMVDPKLLADAKAVQLDGGCML